MNRKLLLHIATCKNRKKNEQKVCPRYSIITVIRFIYNTMFVFTELTVKANMKNNA